MANKINPKTQMPMTALPLEEEKAEVQIEAVKIGPKEIAKANEILRKYKEGKANLESKIISNEEFWKLRQWKYSNDTSDFKPATAWLLNCIHGREADAMDSYPTCNFRPRQEDDKAEAQRLSSIVPIIFEQNRYEDTYAKIVSYMFKQGGACEGIFWNPSLHNGLGDIQIKKIDLLNLFWQPGITDIQDSRYVFCVELVDNEVIEQRYPQTQGKLGGSTFQVSKYLYDDTVDTKDKSVVVDMYYHTEYNGQKVLHYVKYVNDIVLYATENDTQVPTETQIDPLTGMPIEVPVGKSMAERGLYDHGLYPFVVGALYPIEGSICGYGITDIGRDAQIQIDLLNKAITENAIAGSKPRFFTKGDGTINEEEYADTNNTFIHVQGDVGDERIRPIDVMPLPGIYVEVMANKIEELKQVTANQDANNGIASNGVTAASAIAALQESAGKASRTSNKTFHRMYRDVCYQVVELIRQFYDVPRVFRISPDSMTEEFVTYTNAGLVAQQQGVGGQYMGLRLPEFDIEVTSEKASPYKKMEQNELALNFYNQGFFNPQMTDQALACLEMMDFDGKDEVINRIKMNGSLEEKLLKYQQLALSFAQQINPDLGEQVANDILTSGGQPLPAPSGEISLDDSNEHPYVEKARQQARESTQAD